MKRIIKLEDTKIRTFIRKRVAAYARVSSDKDAQLHSLSAQISYYNSYIGSREDWEFAGVYADEALTGTKDNRPEFQRMLARLPGRENRYDHHQVHHPVCPQHCDAACHHPGAEGFRD